MQKRTPREALKVKSVWYDPFADHWYEYPVKAKVQNEIPGIWIPGDAITQAGFTVGDCLETEISPGKLVIRLRTAR